MSNKRIAISLLVLALLLVGCGFAAEPAMDRDFSMPAAAPEMLEMEYAVEESAAEIGYGDDAEYNETAIVTQDGIQERIIIRTADMSIVVVDTEEAEAVQIKRVQHATTSVTYSDEFKEVTTSYSVDTNNAMVLLSVESDNILAPTGKGGVNYAEGPRLIYYRIVFDSATKYLVQRYAANYDTTSNGNTEVATTVMDFVDWANVYSGETIFQGGASAALTKNITLPADVEISKTFVLYDRISRFKTQNENEAMYFKFTLTPKSAPDQAYSDTLVGEHQCYLTAQDNDNSVPVITVNYYVIEFTRDAEVFSGTTQIGATATTTGAVNVSSLSTSDIDQSFLVFNYTAEDTNDGVIGQILTRGRLYNNSGTSAVEFTRGVAGSTGDTVDIAYYVVHLKDDSSRVMRNSSTVSVSGTTMQILSNMFGIFIRSH